MAKDKSKNLQKEIEKLQKAWKDFFHWLEHDYPKEIAKDFGAEKEGGKC